MTLKETLTTTVKRTARGADIPHDRVEKKLAATVLGLSIALFGAAVTAAGIYVLVNVTWSPWLLLVPMAGIGVVLLGGIVMSKDVLIALGEAAGITQRFARAVKGKNGDSRPPVAEG